MKIFAGVPLQEKLIFSKNLALALKSGVSLVGGLKMIRSQTANRNFKKILDQLIEGTNRGAFLSDGMAKYAHVFGTLYVNIIRVAETSGTLPENLLYLGDELRKESDLRKKVRGAMIYPIIILIATVIIATGMIVFVFPKILPLFASFKENLPLTTRMLIFISNAFSQYGLFIALGVVGSLVAIRFLMKVPSIRHAYHAALFRLPLFGRAVINYNMANLSRTLALLLKSGVQIIEAINITGATLTNLVYRADLAKIAEGVRKGEAVSHYLVRYPHRFPPILTNMIEMGENTGNLTNNLFYLAEHYENEVDDFVKNLSSIVEPILLVIMGVVVAFIALAFITPIYQLTRAIK